jgi:oligosaccharyltransferase complex subunit gamma
MTFGSVALGAILLLRFISPILQSKWTWAALTLVTSLIMIGGHMFVRIRGMPYAAHDGSWIASGYQNQYGQEVHVIALICTLSQSLRLIY